MPGPKVADEDIVIGQTLVALGQGMGVASPSAEALSAFLEAFGDRLRARVEDWEEIRLEVVENARQIGRLAAGLADADGSTSVGRAHMRNAIRTAHPPKGETRLLKPCPICP